MGRRLGRYEVLRHLGAGGGGEVLLGRDSEGGERRYVVIKRLLPEFSRQQRRIDMFLDEASVASRLEHPNIVESSPVQWGDDGRPFFVQEFVDGTNLARLQRFVRDAGRQLPVVVAVSIVAAVADALEHAFFAADPDNGRALGVVHRDVNPRNILVARDGAVKLTDFGIAMAPDRRTHTMAGVAKGTLGYMSPEQIYVRELDHRSDLFCLGIVLHELLVGRSLFLGGSDFMVLQRITREAAPPPSSIRPEIEIELDKICLKLLEKKPEDRIQRAGDLVDLLMDWLELHGFDDAQAVVAVWLEELAG